MVIFKFYWLTVLPLLIHAHWTIDSFPNPKRDTDECNSGDDWLFCDPDSYLSRLQRRRVNERLMEIRDYATITPGGPTECARQGFEIMVALVGKLPNENSRREKSEIMREFNKHLLHNLWRPQDECGKFAVITLSIEDQLEHTSELKGTHLLKEENDKAFSLAKEDFRAENIADGVITMANYLGDKFNEHKTQYKKWMHNFLEDDKPDSSGGSGIPWWAVLIIVVIILLCCCGGLVCFCCQAIRACICPCCNSCPLFGRSGRNTDDGAEAGHSWGGEGNMKPPVHHNDQGQDGKGDDTGVGHGWGSLFKKNRYQGKYTDEGNAAEMEEIMVPRSPPPPYTEPTIERGDETVEVEEPKGLVHASNEGIGSGENPEESKRASNKDTGAGGHW